MATQYAFGKIVTDGLVLCLDAADRNSYVSGSTTWSNVAGVNNGTLVNGPTFNTGSGGSIVFDGVNDYANFGNTFNYDVSTPFSLACWFKTNNNESNSPLTISGKAIINSPYTGYQLGLNICTGTAGDRGKFGLAIVNTTVTIMQRQTVLAYNDNIWHYGVATYDGSSTRAGMLIYIDGQVASVTDFNSSSITGTMSNAANFEVGARDGINQPFPGSIATIQIHSRALTAQEVLQNYNAQKSRFGL
jgi:hypothetical protein